jgi:hypothetical protein
MTLKYNISSYNTQNKNIYNYMNLKQKLLLFNAHIVYNGIT